MVGDVMAGSSCESAALSPVFAWCRSIPCRALGPRPEPTWVMSWDIHPPTEAVNAQVSQQQLVLLFMVMTLTLAHCAKDKEMGGEQTLYPPWLTVPMQWPKCESKQCLGHSPVPSTFGKSCHIVSSEHNSLGDCVWSTHMSESGLWELCYEWVCAGDRGMDSPASLGQSQPWALHRASGCHSERLESASVGAQTTLAHLTEAIHTLVNRLVGGRARRWNQRNEWVQFGRKQGC